MQWETWAQLMSDKIRSTTILVWSWIISRNIKCQNRAYKTARVCQASQNLASYIKYKETDKFYSVSLMLKSPPIYNRLGMFRALLDKNPQQYESYQSKHLWGINIKEV